MFEFELFKTSGFQYAYDQSEYEARLKFQHNLLISRNYNT